VAVVGQLQRRDAGDHRAGVLLWNLGHIAPTSKRRPADSSINTR
jgi:hypothetical protein